MKERMEETDIGLKLQVDQRKQIIRKHFAQILC